MLILGKNKDRIVNSEKAASFSVIDEYGAGDTFHVAAHYRPDGGCGTWEILGTYSSKQDAKSALVKIFNAYASERVHEVK